MKQAALLVIYIYIYTYIHTHAYLRVELAEDQPVGIPLLSWAPLLSWPIIIEETKISQKYL